MSQNKRGTGLAMTQRQDRTNELLEALLQIEQEQLTKLEEIRALLAKEKDK